MGNLSNVEIFGRPEVTTLVLKTRFPKVKRAIHCINCGMKLQYTYKDVAMIIQGGADPSAINEEVKCSKCGGIFEIC